MFLSLLTNGVPSTCACVYAHVYCTFIRASINLVLEKQYPLIFLKRLIHYKTTGASCMECCGHANCLRIPIDREESNVRKDKRITMAQ